MSAPESVSLYVHAVNPHHKETTMTRTLTILAAVAALAVSAGAASAGTSSKPPTQSLTYTLNNTMISGYSVTARSSNGIIMQATASATRSTRLAAEPSLPSVAEAVNPWRCGFAASLAAPRRSLTQGVREPLEAA